MTIVNVCHCLIHCFLPLTNNNHAFYLNKRQINKLRIMVFKRKKRPEISKPMNFQHIRKTYFDIEDQNQKYNLVI